MRNFTRDMVSNVSLRDSMSHSCSNPAHERAEVSKQPAVKRRERATRESELLRPVVGQKWVGVLQEGDQHEPVIHPIQSSSVQTSTKIKEWKLTKDRVQDTGEALPRIPTDTSRRQGFQTKEGYQRLKE
jgi:hypothetical protein